MAQQATVRGQLSMVARLRNQTISNGLDILACIYSGLMLLALILWKHYGSSQRPDPRHWPTMLATEPCEPSSLPMARDVIVREIGGLVRCGPEHYDADHSAPVTSVR